MQPEYSKNLQQAGAENYHTTKLNISKASVLKKQNFCIIKIKSTFSEVKSWEEVDIEAGRLRLYNLLRRPQINKEKSRECGASGF